MNKINFTQLRGELIHGHPLARYTSWRVGGKAERFYRPANLSDLQNFISQVPHDEPVTWLGLGSNVLIRDGGIKGTVILTLNRLNEVTLFDENTIRAEAGVTCAKLSKFCVKEGFEKGAFFAGIPGTVGGALAMNAGAFGGETWTHVIGVEVMNRQGQIQRRNPEAFTVQYRQVTGLNDQFFVAGHFRFPRGDAERAKATITQLLKKRGETQPIGEYSCGSVFRNPPGNFAAQLIESAGLKGVRIGDAEVSQKHANFILNRGKATAAHIEELIEQIADRVYQTHGIKLIKEVHVIGEDDKVI